MNHTAHQRIAIIGLDGIAADLLEFTAKNNITPHLGKLMEQQGLFQLKSALPEISSVSWTSFFTGCNPGEHGVYGFYDLNPNTYDYTFHCFSNLCQPPVWELLPAHQKVLIMNVPGTYPARPVNGVMISGFVATDLASGVYPPALYPQLKNSGYRFDPDFNLLKESRQAFLNDLILLNRLRFQIVEKQLQSAWDFVFYVFTETDRLMHFFYQDIFDEQSPFCKSARQLLTEIDEMAGKLTDHFSNLEIPVIFLSDHGFVKSNMEVYLSPLLKDWGYLDFYRKDPTDLKSMKDSTTAFSLDPSRLYIHREKRFSRGMVKAKHCDRMLSQLTARLSTLQYYDQPVIRQIFSKQQYYKGKHMDTAPDLVLICQPGFDLKAGIQKTAVFQKSNFSGMHYWDNAFLIDCSGLVFRHPPADIIQAGALVKEWLLD